MDRSHRWTARQLADCGEERPGDVPELQRNQGALLLRIRSRHDGLAAAGDAGGLPGGRRTGPAPAVYVGRGERRDEDQDASAAATEAESGAKTRGENTHS